MKKILRNKILQFSLVALGGLFLGWLFFHSDNKENATTKEVKKEIWTCSMDPQVKQDHPGLCPICGMDLIPLVTGGGSTMDSTALYLTPEAIQLANIATSTVSRKNPVKELRLYGKVQADERLLQSQTATIPGRIERLYVGFTGETVRKGQLLALLNSPDLIAAQQELLETAKSRGDQPELFEAAKARLRQWKISDGQMEQIVRSGKVKTNFEVLSGSSGIVTAKRVNTGDYVGAGSVLFEVANLSKVWVLFDAYESDLPFLKLGNPIQFSFQALPGQNFQSNIRFIDPVVDPSNRVVRLRVEVDNANGKLKPEMFATGTVQARLNGQGNNLVVPASAVLWTGKRSVVYVKLPDGAFKLREVELGPQLAGSYVVLKGLDEGEEIVTEGAFSVDAAAQLEGKASMMDQ